MKKKVLSSAIVVTMAASMLFGCAGSNSSTDTAADTETSAAGEAAGDASEETEPASGDPLKVTLLVTGSFGDKAFNDSAQAGMQRLMDEMGDQVEVEMIEMGNDKTKFEGSMLDASESDADIIITGLWDMKEITEQVAQEFPDKRYIIFDTDVDYSLGDLSNVYSMSYKQNECAFLAGVLAASLTTSDVEYANEDAVIGFVGARDTAVVINDSAVGYIQGAQFVNPDIKVMVSYVGSYVDSATAKELALTQYSSGADCVFVAAGPASVGVIEAAAESQKYVIGVDSDQAAALKDSQPDMANVIITSAIKNISDNAVKAVDRAMKDEIPYGTREVFGIAEGAVGIAENEFYEKLLSEEDRAKVEELKQQVIAGEVEMTPTAGITTEKINEIRDAVRP